MTDQSPSYTLLHANTRHRATPQGRACESEIGAKRLLSRQLAAVSRRFATASSALVGAVDGVLATPANIVSGDLAGRVLGRALSAALDGAGGRIATLPPKLPACSGASLQM